MNLPKLNDATVLRLAQEEGNASVAAGTQSTSATRSMLKRTSLVAAISPHAKKASARVAKLREKHTAEV